MGFDNLEASVVEEAKRASRHAYHPYSAFPVGAAILAQDGSIFSGCNIENASYGLTICAERGAVAAMVRAGVRKIRLMVIYTPTATPTAPCGACRQVLSEFSPEAQIVCVCDGPGRLRTTVAALLPDAFGPQDL